MFKPAVRLEKSCLAIGPQADIPHVMTAASSGIGRLDLTSLLRRKLVSTKTNDERRSALNLAAACSLSIIPEIQPFVAPF
jgi:hypothetical protein